MSKRSYLQWPLWNDIEKLVTKAGNDELWERTLRTENFNASSERKMSVRSTGIRLNIAHLASIDLIAAINSVASPYECCTRQLLRPSLLPNTNLTDIGEDLPYSPIRVQYISHIGKGEWERESESVFSICKNVNNQPLYN